MEQIKIHYEKSKISTARKVRGFLINVDVGSAFDLYCNLKGSEKSQMVEDLIRTELEKYIRGSK